MGPKLAPLHPTRQLELGLSAVAICRVLRVCIALLKYPWHNLHGLPLQGRLTFQLSLGYVARLQRSIVPCYHRAAAQFTVEPEPDVVPGRC